MNTILIMNTELINIPKFESLIWKCKALLIHFQNKLIDYVLPWLHEDSPELQVCIQVS